MKKYIAVMFDGDYPIIVGSGQFKTSEEAWETLNEELCPSGQGYVLTEIEAKRLIKNLQKELEKR